MPYSASKPRNSDFFLCQVEKMFFQPGFSGALFIPVHTTRITEYLNMANTGNSILVLMVRFSACYLGRMSINLQEANDDAFAYSVDIPMYLRR